MGWPRTIRKPDRSAEHREPYESRGSRTVLGARGGEIPPRDSHTFASFYRGDDLAAGKVHPATISWLPATGVVRFGSVERGKNFSLEETLALAKRRGYRLASYGPYEISAQTYSRALLRVRLLSSGRIAYTMINVVAGAMNCIEAVASVGGPINTGINYGFAASETVASHLALHRGQIDRDVAGQLRLAGNAPMQ
jgi:hypothetical protein